MTNRNGVIADISRESFLAVLIPPADYIQFGWIRTVSLNSSLHHPNNLARCIFLVHQMYNTISGDAVAQGHWIYEALLGPLSSL